MKRLTQLILIAALLTGCAGTAQTDKDGAALNSRSALSTEEVIKGDALPEDSGKAVNKEVSDDTSQGSANEAENDTEASEIRFFAMDTYMHLTVYGADEDVLEAARMRVEELESEFSVTRSESDISKLNAEKNAELSEDTLDLMEKALGLCERTDGAIDITIYPVVREWGFTTSDYHIPDGDTLNRLLENVDYKRVRLNGAVASIDDGMMVDLGCIGKGYTGEMLAELLKERGVDSALLDLGGNIQTVGVKPDGSMWEIAIKNPITGDPAGKVSIQDEAVITSGGYERYFTGDDGKIYWHIMDPETGYPAESGLLSVTIISKSGTLCDALSTSLFVMGEEKAAEHWRQYGDFEAVMIAADGKIYITEGLKSRFTPYPDIDPDSIVVIE